MVEHSRSSFTEVTPHTEIHWRVIIPYILELLSVAKRIRLSVKTDGSPACLQLIQTLILAYS